jgi:hypothetical protein
MGKPPSHVLRRARRSLNPGLAFGDTLIHYLSLLIFTLGFVSLWLEKNVVGNIPNWMKIV